MKRDLGETNCAQRDKLTIAQKSYSVNHLRVSLSLGTVPLNILQTPREVSTIFTVRSRIDRSSHSVQFAI